MEESLERSRYALERRGVKVSRSKTKYIFCEWEEMDGKVTMQGAKVVKVK